MKNFKVMILNLPSPPGMDVYRDYSGGYGTAHLVKRKSYGHSLNIVFPVFMPYLATKIKKEGYNLEIVDAQALRLNEENTIRRISKKQPDFLVSMISLPSLYGDIHLLDTIKERVPESCLIGIGTVCKFLGGEEILANSKVDFLINGEYPFYSRPIIQLLHAIEKKSPFERQSLKNISGLIYKETKQEDGKFLIKHNSPTQELENGEEHLDDLDMKVYNELPIENYKLHLSDAYGRNFNYFPILSGKGCPFSCIYCPYPLGFGKKLSYKTPEILVKEMEFLSEKFGLKAFLFRDQVFTQNPARVEKICDLISKRELNVRWLFETRVDKIPKDLLKKMKKSGCNRIHYGVETGDETLLKKIGKPGLSREIIKEVFKNTMEEGIFTMAHVILGLPGENEKTLTNTYNFLLELNPDAISWNLITPYPGTKLFEIAKRKNLILTYDWRKYNTEEIVMRTEKLSGEDLIKFKKNFDRNFRIRKIFRRMKKFHRKKDREFLIRGTIYKISEISEIF
jgi:radical SAM superfamily enzyme YgiQ (UPF0313 family)